MPRRARERVNPPHTKSRYPSHPAERVSPGRGANAGTSPNKESAPTRIRGGDRILITHHICPGSASPEPKDTFGDTPPSVTGLSTPVPENSFDGRILSVVLANAIWRWPRSGVARGVVPPAGGGTSCLSSRPPHRHRCRLSKPIWRKRLWLQSLEFLLRLSSALHATGLLCASAVRRGGRRCVDCRSLDSHLRALRG